MARNAVSPTRSRFGPPSRSTVAQVGLNVLETKFVAPLVPSIYAHMRNEEIFRPMSDPLMLGVFALIAVLGGLAACGGGSSSSSSGGGGGGGTSDPGTTAGTYTFTVVATGTATGGVSDDRIHVSRKGSEVATREALRRGQITRMPGQAATAALGGRDDHFNAVAGEHFDGGGIDVGVEHLLSAAREQGYPGATLAASDGLVQETKPQYVTTNTQWPIVSR